MLLGEVYKLFPGLTAEDGSTVKWPVQTPRDGKETLIQGLKTYRDLKEPDAADGALEDSQWERKFLELYRVVFRAGGLPGRGETVGAGGILLL